MKKYILFLLFSVNYCYSQIENEINPKIAIFYSCKKQATLILNFENGISPNNYKTEWKKNGVPIQNQGFAKYLIITELGNYSCEIEFEGTKKESNILTLSEFPETGFKENFLPNSKLFYSRNDTIFTANEVVTFEINIISNSKTKFTYFLNDKIVENQETNQFKNIDKLKTYKLNFRVSDSLCNYQSKSYVFANEYVSNIKTGIDTIIYCNGETSKIDKNNVLAYGGDIISIKSEWFKNDSLFSTNISDFLRAQTTLKTQKSGVYFLKTTLQMNAGEFILNSEKINVLFKNEIIIPGSKFSRKLCPTIPELSYQFLAMPVEKVTWFQDFSTVQPNQFSIDTTSNTTKLNVASSGNYSLKVSYKNGCETTSENIPFDFENRIQINPVSKNEVFCKNDLLLLGDFEEFRNLQFNLIWKHNDEIQVNNQANNKLFSVEKPGNYQLSARHTSGTCILNSNVINIDFPQINDNLNFIDSIQLCNGKSVKLRLADSTSNILNWYRDNAKLDFNQKEIEVTEKGNYYALFKTVNCPENSGSTSKSLKINELPKPTTAISGSKNIDYNQTADLKFELTSAPPWQIKLNTGEEFTINETPYTLKVRPLSDIKYSVSSVSNICGLGTASGEALIKVTILADEKSSEKNTNLKVFPIPVSDIFELELLETNGESAQIMLFDNLGKETQNHFTKSINNKINKTLNINELPSGIYNLKVQIGDKNYTRKIVKQ